MEIYFMPDMKLAYLVTNVGNGSMVLSDSMEFVPLPLNQMNVDGIESKTPYQQQNKDTPIPKEIIIVGLGNYGRRPMLFIRTKAELLIYRVSSILHPSINAV